MQPIEAQIKVYEKLCKEFPTSKLIKVARPKPNATGQLVITYTVEHNGTYMDRSEVL